MSTRLLATQMFFISLMMCSLSIAQEKGIEDSTPLSQLRGRAERGHIKDELNFARALQAGKGTKQDVGEAAKWFLKAAHQGNPEAQTEIGYMYAMGLGVAQSPEEAFRWFQRAASSAYAPAENDLGSMLFGGFGTKMDAGAAMSWWKKAAEQGLAEAQVNLAVGLASQNQPNLDAEVVQWFKKAANKGNPRGQYFLGTMYEMGRGVPKDLRLAAKWYHKSADQAYSPAENNLAVFYAKGYGVKQDLPAAVELYLKAAEQGNENAMVNLAYLLATAHANPKYADAYFWSFIALRRDTQSIPERLTLLLAKLHTQLGPDETPSIEERARDWMNQHPFLPEKSSGGRFIEVGKLRPD